MVGTEDVIDDAGRFTAPAVVVLKYDADGAPVWPTAAVYEPAAGDASMRTFELSDAALDKAGDVYVCGTLYSHWWGVGGEMAGHAIKLSGADGALVASRTDACPPGTESQFASIAVRGSTVAVAGMTLDMTDSGGIADAHGLVASFDLGLQEAHRRVWDPGETKYEAFSDVELDAKGRRVRDRKSGGVHGDDPHLRGRHAADSTPISRRCAGATPTRLRRRRRTPTVSPATPTATSTWPGSSGPAPRQTG